MLVRTTALAAALLAAPALAAAHPDAAHDAGFATLDRTGDGSGGGADLSYIFIDGVEDATFLRLDLHGQYLSPEGFGAYVDLPVALAFGEGDDVTAIGNIEAAGVFRLYGASGLDWVFRGGLLLPTAGDGFDDFAANLIGTIGARLTDLPTAVPDSTWLRLGVSPIFRQGVLFLRADAGVDLPVDEPDGSDFDPLARLNIGVGARLAPQLAITGELVNSINLGDGDDNFVHSAAVSVRFPTGAIEPFAAVVVPFDDPEEDFDVWAITAGVTGGL